MHTKKEMHIAYNTRKYKCSYICRMPHVESTESTKVDHKTLVACMVSAIYTVDLWKYIYGSRLKAEQCLLGTGELKPYIDSLAAVSTLG